MYPHRFGLNPCDQHYEYVMINLTSRLRHVETRKIAVKFADDHIPVDGADELPDLVPDPYEMDGADESMEPVEEDE